MAQLIVRNLDDDLVRRLRIRAAENGRSAEEEHREILREVLRRGGGAGFKALLRGMPDAGDDADFARSDDTGRDVEL